MTLFVIANIKSKLQSNFRPLRPKLDLSTNFYNLSTGCGWVFGHQKSNFWIYPNPNIM